MPTMNERLELLASERVSAAVVAQWVGLHERQVRELARTGVIERDGHGTYELRATVRAIYTRTAEQAAGRAENSAGGLDW